VVAMRVADEAGDDELSGGHAGGAPTVTVS
jgi:hypothetical protein